MSEQKNIKIIIVAGLAGSGKTSVVEYLTSKGIPKISVKPEDDFHSIESQVNGIAAAGQHQVVIDGLSDWNIYKALKHEFHGQTTTLVTTASRHNRHNRLVKRTENPIPEEDIDQSDYESVESANEGGIIAFADYYIENDDSLEKLQSRVDETLQQINT